MKNKFPTRHFFAATIILMGSWHFSGADEPAQTPGQAPAGVSSANLGAMVSGGTPSGGGSADNLLFTGSFLYNVPLEVPPGLAGMEPKLTLQYNSSAGNGWVGVGWDLSLGSIQRSTKNGVPKYDNTDTFVLTLGGQTQELVKIPDGSYRSKIEGAFQKFIFESGAWVVYDKTGMRMYFGQTSAGRLGNVYLWALDKVVDRNGNSMAITYDKSQGDGQIYPHEVFYTGNENTGRLFDRKIEFVMESRPDIVGGFRTGFEIKTSKRLSRVDGYILKNGAWDRVSSHGLTYINRANSARSLLSEIYLHGYDAADSHVIRLAKFNYPAENQGWDNSPSYPLPHYLSRGPNTWVPFQTQVIDVNGDGLPDVTHGDDVEPDMAWINMGTGWNSSGHWAPPVDFFVGGAMPNGAQYVDLNGDALPDVVAGRAGYNPNTWLNTGNGWTAAPQFELPHITTTEAGINIGTMFIDLNGDNRADFILASSGNLGTVKKTWINNGNGWDYRPEWNLPLYLTNGAGYPTQNAQFVDLNGDRKPDFVSAPHNGPHQTWINTGSGWSEQPQWAIAENLSADGGHNQGVQFVDVNADGLSDLVASSYIGAPYKRSYINTGNGWVERPEWNLPSYLSMHQIIKRTGAVFQDLNGDGLQDFMIAFYTPGGNTIGGWINTGNGWSAQVPQWSPPHALGLQDNLWPGAMITDINGDQLGDYIVSYQTNKNEAWFSAASPHADFLSSIENAFGGKTVVDYEKSSSYANTFLPFPMWVVKSITRQGGNPNALDVVTNFTYAGGLFDIVEKEFLGFRTVESVDADGNKSVSTFLQKKNAQNQDVPANALKGRVQKVEQFNAAGTLLTRQETDWTYLTPFSGVYFVRPSKTKSTLADVSPNLVTQVDYFYDDAPGGAGFGNVIRTVNQGDLSVNGDEKTDLVEYALNAGAYLVGFPQRSVVQDSLGNSVSEIKYFYDGSETLGTVTRGNLTKVSRLLSAPNAAPRWVDARTIYNNFGQPTDVEDALHRHVTTVYDAFGFPASVTNTLGHTVVSVYDPRNGNVLSDTDPNNQTTTYKYDPLGRRTKVIGPLDSEAFPSSLTDYHDDLRGNPLQQYTETRNRVNHGQSQVLWRKSYFDGMGQAYRTEQNDEGSSFVISETVFNNRGLAWRTSAPRLNTSGGPVLWTYTTYDALGRAVQMQRPDGSVTSTSYQGRTTYIQDPNGKVQSSVADAYGRVIRRNEPSIPTPTQYAYDTLGRLSQVTDSQGMVSSFVYDSFGRKIAMSDPNAGAWSYSYDDNGNLLQQTDARNVTVSFVYDTLDRVVNKTLSGDPDFVTAQSVGTTLSAYTMDAVAPAEQSSWPYEKGRVIKTSDPSGDLFFYHDRLGRIVKEIKRVGSVDYRTLTSYDALNRVTQVTYPNDQVVKYVYDDAGRLSQVTNGDGSVVYASYPSYNALGQPLLRHQNDAQTTTTYEYHPTNLTLNRLATQRNAGAQALQDLSYTFDPAGNITAIADAVHPERNQIFTYDDLYRLTRAQGFYGDQAFAYDRLGNFQTKSGIEYLYEASTHPYAVTRTRPLELPGVDASTALAWDLDSSEPIYAIAGTVMTSSQTVVSSVAVVASGLFDQAVLTDLQGHYQVRGLAASSYAISISSGGVLATPAGQAFNPLSTNQAAIDFTLSQSASPSLDPSKLRVPRTAVAIGAPAGVQAGDVFTAGNIVSSPSGEITSGGGHLNVSGYSPVADAADFWPQPSAQYVLPAEAVTQGVIGPNFIEGRYREALSFNGLIDAFVFPNTSAINPSGLTLMVWIKPLATPSFGHGTLIGKSSAAAPGALESGYRLLMNSSGQIVFEIGKSGGSALLSSPNAVPLNKWTYVAATYNGSQMVLYINGSQAATAANTAGIVANENAVVLGALLTPTKRIATGTLYYGAIDDPRIQTRAWTLSEIAGAYAAYQNIATYAYDANGNMRQKTANGVTSSYQFDSEGRLLWVKAGTTTIASYVYDGGGARVKKTTASGSTLYIGKMYEERPGGTQVTHVYAGSDLICDLVKPSGGITQPYYVLSDHLGSTSLVTDATSTIIEETAYDPFGATIISSGTSPLTLKYTGQEQDPETNLSYYNARYYDPTLGRFVSADTLIPAAGDPQSFNRYAYCRNSPIIMVDPDGHNPLVIAIVISAAIGAAQGGTHGEMFNRHAWKNFDWNGAVAGAAAGIVSGAVGYGIGTLIGPGLSTLGLAGDIMTGGMSGSLASGAGYVTSAKLNDQNIDGKTLGRSLLSGAIIGGVAGGVTSDNLQPFLKGKESFLGRPGEFSQLPPEIQKTFAKGKYRHFKLQSDVEATRFWSDGVDMQGSFLTTKQTVAQIASPEQAIKILKLPVKNLATDQATFTIPMGSDVYIGRVEGGGMTATQIFIRNKDLIIFQRNVTYDTPSQTFK